jgi:CRISPR-associated endonuclease/helicase Cas3
VVTILKGCFARPGQELECHLEQVAFAAGNPRGSLDDQLMFLGGLLHDAGKARATWQEYLQRSVAGKRKETLPHAYIGAALFALYGHSLLALAAHPLEGEQLYYLLARDLQDHHGRLRDWYTPPHMAAPPWNSTMSAYPPEDLAFADLDALVRRYLPLKMSGPIVSYDTFRECLAHLEKNWARNLLRHHLRLQQVVKPSPSAYASWICREATGHLIASDRLSAGDVADAGMPLTPDSAEVALSWFKEKLNEKYLQALNEGRSAMAARRQSVHELTLANYARNRDAPWFTLNLPVGWGKTLISLRLALERVVEGCATRIVYVAPYLAILSQSAKEIREVTGLEVLEHHHLALLGIAPEAPDPPEVFTMESWRAPVIATTFNQLFRAVFPASAQQTIRIPALRRAFVIVDEPQIMNSNVYNAFLRALDVLRERSGAQVLLVSATLPPTGHALVSAPHPVAPEVESAGRYTLATRAGSWTEEQLARKALWRLDRHRQVAVILNTIADAVATYRLIAEHAKDCACLNLHGMMTPLHKARIISDIARRIRRKERVVAVSTQVLEAGLDLSFRSILRARPVLSSVVQSAGRANRHAEGEMTLVEVFDFVRKGGLDTRRFVYANEQQRQVTDELLPRNASWTEAHVGRLIESYFERLGVVDPGIEALDRFEGAAKGQWSLLAGLDPFDTLEEAEGNELSELNARVFVATPEAWITPIVRNWMEYFNLASAQDVYALYRDQDSLMQRSFSDRKRFFALMEQFVAPLRLRLIPQVCGQIEPGEVSILRAQDDKDYREDTGFGHLLLPSGGAEIVPG